jgi:hypothetical protein
MKLTVAAVIILIVILNIQLHSCSTSSEAEEDDEYYISSLIELTDQNFTEAISTNNFLVFFFWHTLV